SWTERDVEHHLHALAVSPSSAKFWTAGDPTSDDTRYLFESQDNGLTWREQGVIAHSGVHDICSVNNLIAWALGSEQRIHITRDGGASRRTYVISSRSTDSLKAACF